MSRKPEHIAVHQEWTPDARPLLGLPCFHHDMLILRAHERSVT